jgi:hypothetical protein
MHAIVNSVSWVHVFLFLHSIAERDRTRILLYVKNANVVVIITVLLLLWNYKSITSLLWIPKTMYHILGIELHMKRKFTECLTKRHRSTAEYLYVVTQSAVESEDAERGFRMLSGDFEC